MNPTLVGFFPERTKDNSQLYRNNVPADEKVGYSSTSIYTIKRTVDGSPLHDFYVTRITSSYFAHWCYSNRRDSFMSKSTLANLFTTTLRSALTIRNIIIYNIQYSIIFDKISKQNLYLLTFLVSNYYLFRCSVAIRSHFRFCRVIHLFVQLHILASVRAHTYYYMHICASVFIHYLN